MHDHYLYLHKEVLALSDSDWTQIYKEVDKGDYSIASIARKYKIAASTLQTRLKTRKTASTLEALGAPLSLPPEIEKKLVDAVIDFSNAGYALTRMKFKPIIKEIAVKAGIEGIVGGKAFVKGFLERNAGAISAKAPKKINSARITKFNRVIVTKWFEVFREIVAQYEPAQIFNADDKFINLETMIPKTVSQYELLDEHY
jgi:transposase-like protein